MMETKNENALKRLAEKLKKAETMAQAKDAAAKKAHERVSELREKYNALLVAKMANTARSRGIDFGTLTGDEISFLVQSLAERRAVEPAPAQAPVPASSPTPAPQKTDEFAYDPFR